MDDPIYYINHFSPLKRPAIYSKHEYWIVNTLSYMVLVLFLAGWAAFVDYPISWVAIIALMAILGSAYNFRKGRERAKHYKEYWKEVPTTPR